MSQQKYRYESSVSLLDYVIVLWVTLKELIFLNLIRKYFGNGMCKSDTRIDGQTAIVTGSNTGIGKEMAKDLAKRGAHVIVACRDARKGNDAVNDIISQTGNKNVIFKHLDLASIESIKQFASDVCNNYDKIDILINNAGVFLCSYSNTKDGFEMHFGVNYLGHFLLTLLLLNKMKRSSDARIINLTSHFHRIGTINFDDINLNKSYYGLNANEQAQLARVLFTKELSKRLKHTGVTTYCVHPGIVKTEIFRFIENSLGLKFLNILWNIQLMFYKTPYEGSQTAIYCAVDESVKSHSGLYYEECSVVDTSASANDSVLSKLLWDYSCDLLNMESFKNI